MSTILREIGPQSVQPFRFTAEQYHALMERGIIEEGAPYELLDGMVVHKDRAKAGDDPMTIGDEHAYVVQMLFRKLDTQLAAIGWHLRVQQPIDCGEFHEPEPDAAIVHGDPQAYRRRKPGPRDVACVIEVADSSLQRDRTTKLRIYAAAGIGQYVILNLIDRIAEVYTDPRRDAGEYGTRHTLTAGQTLPLPAVGGPVDLSLTDLLT